ncbi:MAG TPA: hypothetical protein PLO39_13305 [Saprospiraceae bacterium]|jgi:hypothetical protein|nr:hypothetical protein [Saprospiraceae bacterium]
MLKYDALRLSAAIRSLLREIYKEMIDIDSLKGMGCTIIFLLLLIVSMMCFSCTKEEPIIITPNPIDSSYCWVCQFEYIVKDLKTLQNQITLDTYYPCKKTTQMIRNYEDDNYIYWENLNVSHEYIVTCDTLK